MNDFWSLLLHTGYLTVDWEQTKKEDLAKENNKDIFVKIPNLEILECFEHNIQNRFNTKIAPNSVADTLANNLFEGNAEIASDTIYNLLQICYEVTFVKYLFSDLDKTLFSV